MAQHVIRHRLWMDSTPESITTLDIRVLSSNKSECFSMMRRAERENNKAVYRYLNGFLRMFIAELRIRDMSIKGVA